MSTVRRHTRCVECVSEMAEAAESRNPGSIDHEVLNSLRQLLRGAEPWLVGPREQDVSVDELLAGRFTVFGKPVRLTPPVDWSQDPHGNRSWRYELHTLKWLKPLLLKHAEDGDLACLSAARDILLDWAAAHLEPTAEVSEFGWYDMAVGLRAPYFAYVLRASLVADDIDDEDAELLLRAAERHGAELADEARYAAGHNHGLFQDEGLYILGRQLSVLPEAAAWRSLALTRLRSTLEQTVNFAEGAHLEHSSAYQFSIAGLVARLAENIPEMPELHDLRDRLRRTAAWHVTPANRLAQLGDTDDVPAPKWACRAASKLHGINALFEAGQAFVRDGDGYLAVSAGYHSSAHKHADDTGFILVENGVTVLSDAGRWGYYEEPDRLYAQSAFAHNVLTVDEQDFDWREREPHRSGLLAASEEDGWYAILAKNPLLKRQGVDHRRLLLYHPGELLVVIDEARANEQHDYARRFHFGPGLAARFDAESCVEIGGERTTATLVDLGREARVKLDRARDEPTHLGWSYPADRERLPVWTATLRTRAADASMTAVLRLGDSTLTVARAAFDADRAVLETSAGTAEVRFERRQPEAEIRPMSALRGQGSGLP